MADRVIGILVTHGSLGSELVRTAESILGPQDGIEVVSNTDASLTGLSETIRARISGRADAAVYLFVDLLGGSCGAVCQDLRRAKPDARIFSGVNLPMLLEFFHSRGRVPDEELCSRLLAKGRDGIQCL